MKGRGNFGLAIQTTGHDDEKVKVKYMYSAIEEKGVLRGWL